MARSSNFDVLGFALQGTRTSTSNRSTKTHIDLALAAIGKRRHVTLA
jgi:hypothetical protein